MEEQSRRDTLENNYSALERVNLGLTEDLKKIEASRNSVAEVLSAST